MKRILLLITLCIIGVGGVAMARSRWTVSPRDLVPSKMMGLASSPSTPFAATITPAIPKKLRIPSLSIDASVESVGMDEQGNMDVPKLTENVAWYSLGFKPGEQGSAVIGGHYDTATGAPAVFYELSSLQNGDKVIVSDERDKEYVYVVEDSTIYGFDQLPMQEIFADSTQALLRLITCSGTFDAITKNYSKRLVVTARLQS